MNNLSISENQLEDLHFTSNELATIRTIGEYRGKQDLYAKQSPEVLENLRTVAKIESNESSNRIEGIIVERRRVENIVNHPKKRLKNSSEQEVAGYRDALQLIHESEEHMPLNSNNVLQLHNIICKYAPNPGGRWKPTDNEIIETDATGNKKIHFKAVSAVQTPHAMNDWASDYQDAIKTLDPLIIIPLSILDFLCIHPFLDGNGRTSRLLTLLMLYQADYQVGRFISLERVIEQSKESYYETLQKSSQNWHEGKQDIKPWLHYFWGVLIKAYRELDEKVVDIKSGKGSKTEMIRQAVNNQVGPFSIAELQNQLPTIGRAMIKLVLADLKEEGAIELQGKGRGAQWVKRLGHDSSPFLIESSSQLRTLRKELRMPEKGTRDTQAVECYCLLLYLYILVQKEQLSYPISVSKSDSPDWIITHNNTSFGLEVTTLTDQKSREDTANIKRDNPKTLIEGRGPNDTPPIAINVNNLPRGRRPAWSRKKARKDLLKRIEKSLKKKNEKLPIYKKNQPKISHFALLMYDSDPPYPNYVSFSEPETQEMIEKSIDTTFNEISLLREYNKDEYKSAELLKFPEPVKFMKSAPSSLPPINPCFRALDYDVGIFNLFH